MRPDIVSKNKSSSHPLAPGRVYTGIVKSVDAKGFVSVRVMELGSTFEKVMPLNTTPSSRLAVGNSVKCGFSDEFFTELIIYGSAGVRSDSYPTIAQYDALLESVSNNPTFTYKVGDTGPGGGIIFFVDRYDEYDGFTYLEVAPSSTERLRTWAPSTPTNYQATAVTGADSKALGGGYQNTIDIVAQGHTDTATSAAYYCDQLTFGGQSDWYLPSFAEMKMVYDVVFLQLGVTGFAQNFYYWTSSERHTETNIAHTQYFATGQQSYSQKSSTNYVRPVRRFS